MFKLVSEKAEEPEIKLSTSVGSSKKKAREFQKNIYSALLTTPKPLTVWVTTNCGKFLRDGKARSPYLTPERQQFVPDME